MFHGVASLHPFPLLKSLGKSAEVGRKQAASRASAPRNNAGLKVTFITKISFLSRRSVVWLSAT